MSNIHDASGQFAGYLYQAYAALIQLLNDSEQNSQICIEKFDDISFMQNDIPMILIQTKHQIYSRGNLIDSSKDIWRTINSWCSAINNFDEDTLRVTRFHLLTTAIASNNDAAYFLKQNNRDNDKAQKLLEETAIAESQITNISYYQNFMKLSPEFRKIFINNIYIFDNSAQIFDIRSKIKSLIQWASLPKFEDNICERLEGWWFEKIIQCLCSTSPVFIAKNQLRTKIFDIASEYKLDSLPINIDELEYPSEDSINGLNENEKIFIKQLNLISLSDERIKRAIRDFYNAYQQRSQWLREELLYIDELENYEKKLIDEWNRLYLIMKENLEDYKDTITEEQKIFAGKKLYSEVENLNIYVRERVTKPFIMRGTYHSLANNYKVGWHIDFVKRLKFILGD